MMLPHKVFSAVMRATIDRWLDRMVERLEEEFRARGIPVVVRPHNEKKAAAGRLGGREFWRRRRKGL